MFHPPVAVTLNPTKRLTYAFGDMDGGFARTMLGGIRAGMVQLQTSDLTKLCYMLKQEQNALSDESATFIAFQSNPQISATQQALADNAQYFDAPNSAIVVYVGDILYDRLSNNQVAHAQLLRQLHQHGAVIIFGNHDNYADAQRICTSDYWWDYQRGCHATMPLSQIQAESLQQTVFVNAYFDADNNILYSHNGVVKSALDPQTLITAFGDITNYAALDVTAIAQFMLDGTAINQTIFRPEESAMELVNLQHNGVATSIVHGHDGYFDYSHPKVINLNARSLSSPTEYLAAGIELHP
jgi:predicted MPP superfamily phosphohydrolase